MNAKRAKRLRRETRAELAGERTQERELVVGRVHGNTSMTTALNDPFSVRGMYRGLKRAWSEAVKASK